MPETDTLDNPQPDERLWRIGDVADWLTVSDNTARDLVAATPELPAPIVEVSRIRLWYPPQWNAWADATARTHEQRSCEPNPDHGTISDGEHLWRIGDVARWLTLSENTTRTVLADHADTPTPILMLGPVRLWHPGQWHRWARLRAGLPVAGEVPEPAGGLW